MNMRKTIGKRLVAAVTGLALSATVATTMLAPLAVSAANYNYAEALELSLYFYDANKCGTGITDAALTWRGDCHTYDSQLALTNTNLSSSFISQNSSILDPDGDGKIDVSGGFHDAGDHVKFGITQAYSAASLAWGYYEFKDAFVQSGTEDHFLEIMKTFGDYMLKSTFINSNGECIAFCYQVGDGGSDHSIWSAPESQTLSRPGFFAYSGNAATEECAQTAAALAGIAYCFKDIDADYANECITAAKALYALGNKYKGTTSQGTSGFYSSSNGYNDDIAWAEVWLHIATGEASYLNSAKNASVNDYWVHCWDKVWGGYCCLMYDITNDSKYQNLITERLNSLSNSDKTPGGYYAIGGGWGSARYNTAWQMYALTYAQKTGSSDWTAKAAAQMAYLLGNNKYSISYLIGYGSYYPTHPHHRGSGQNLSSANDTGDQKYVLYGALVGGPDSSDNYEDKTSDYTKNEVAIDYNACCVGALAGLYLLDDSSGKTRDYSGVSEINSDYQFLSEYSSPVVVTRLWGDATNDGIVDVRDVALMAKYTANNSTSISAEGLLNADVKADGVINILDVAMAAKLAAGMLTQADCPK